MSLSIGDKVQLVNKDSQAKDGVLVSVTPPRRPKPERYWIYTDEEQAEMISYATIKWDDGSESVENFDKIDFRDSELERQFRVQAFNTKKLIAEKISAAAALLSEAEVLSEEHGIPFSSPISHLSQSYYPFSYEEKYPSLDKRLVENITGAQSEYGCTGWEHSQICY